MGTTIVITSTLRGSVGNSYGLSTTSSAISLSGATLAGGSDRPASPAPSYETGQQTFLEAADRWTSDETNGITALQEIAASERGMFWVSRDGTVIYKSRAFRFRSVATAAKLTIDGQQNTVDASLAHERMYNRIEVKYTPRVVLASGVIAAAKSVVTVPGQSGTARWNGTVALPGGGSVVVKLPFTDPATGQSMGGKSVITPLVPTTDWTANDLPDGTGFDYTGAEQLSFSVAINGSNAEVSIANTALGPLYLTKLQLRGSGLVNYNPTATVAEDTAYQDIYGKRTLSVEMPLTSSSMDIFTRTLADYLLSRYKIPFFQLTSLALYHQNLIGSVNLFDIEIGDIVVVNDPQLVISAQRYMVIGLQYSGIAPQTIGTITFYVSRLDDQSYWILQDSTYGVLDVTTRPAV